MQSRLEELAPGFGSRILKRRVLGPVEMETRDANLIGGSINGGTSQLHQQLVFRPIPGWGEQKRRSRVSSSRPLLPTRAAVYTELPA